MNKIIGALPCIPNAELDCLVYYLTCVCIYGALKFKPTMAIRDRPIMLIFYLHLPCIMLCCNTHKIYVL